MDEVTAIDQPIPAVAGPAPGRRVWLLAVLPVVAFLLVTSVRIASRPALHFDEHIFLDVGRHIVDTGLPTRTWGIHTSHLFFDHTPLYVYVVAAVMAFGGPTVEFLRALSLLCGLLTVLAVFRIGLVVRGPGSGFVGAMLLACNPFFATYAWFVRMEVPLCLCLVLGVLLLHERRHLLAGLAIAVAVMLKEIALAFWLVAVVYAALTAGRRAALAVGLPSPVAFGAWLAYAAVIGPAELRAIIGRWTTSAVGFEAGNRRFVIGPLAWTRTVAGRVVGPVLDIAAAVTAVLAAVWRPRIPRITAVPAAYTLLAVAASYAISLKEPRYLIATVPMIALAIGLVIDWDDAWIRLRRRVTRNPRTRPDRARDGSSGDTPEPGQSPAALIGSDGSSDSSSRLTRAAGGRRSTVPPDRTTRAA